MLQKLLKPKWKHSKPAVRREALMALPPASAESQTILTEIINNDDDLGVRRLAVKRSTDLALLKTLADDIAQAELAADAGKRLGRLLAGQEELSPPLSDRLAFIGNLADQTIEAYLLREAQEVDVRLKLLQRIDRQAQLGDIALNDADASVRLAAAERIEQRSTLERVAKQARRKDKTVFALVNERLNADSEKIAQRERQEKQLKLLCAQMDALLQNSRLDGKWLAREDEYATLVEQWPQHVEQWQADYGPCDDALVERFQQAQSAVALALQEKQAEREALQAQQAVVATQSAEQDESRNQLVALIEELRQSQTPTDAMIDTWSSRLSALHERLQSPDRQECSDLLSEASKLITAAKTYLQDSLGLSQLLADITAQGESADKAGYDHWCKKLDAYGARQQYVLDSADLNAAKDGLEKLHVRLQAAQQTQAAIFDGIEEKLRAAEDAINTGEVIKANKLLAAVKSQWESGDLDLVGQRYTKLFARYQHLNGRVSELNDWRRWSGAPVLEELVASMEALAELVEQDAEVRALDYADVGQRVRDARAKWKSFGAGGVARSKALWARFDQACNTAYAPCQSFFEKQGEIRAANLRQRESICADLDAYLLQLKQQAAEDVDWQAVTKIIQTARQEWSSLGTVERKQFLAVNKRFNRILSDIHSLLAAQRSSNFETKTRLINQAERLAADVDEGRAELKQAIDEIKALQAQWKAVGPAEKDRSLWTSFRALCDQIFNQRDAQRKEQDQAREAQHSTLVKIAEQLEGLTINDADQVQKVLHTFADIKRDWAEQTANLRRNPVQKRFDSAARKFQQTHKAFLLQQTAQLREQQQQMAVLCSDAEHLLWRCLQEDQPCADEISSLHARWEKIPSPADELGGGIAERFNAILTMLNKAGSGEKDNILRWLQSVEQQNKQIKEELCLQLEVLCGAPSPDAAKQARVSYQVKQLEKKMKHGDVFDHSDKLDKLLLAWHKSGMVTQQIASQLEARFAAALAHCENSISAG